MGKLVILTIFDLDPELLWSTGLYLGRKTENRPSKNACGLGKFSGLVLLLCRKNKVTAA
jgi:hypothetical protein